VQVTGITNATAVSVGYNNSCARLSDGTLKCWGDGYWGQLWNGNSGASAGSLVPVFVRNIANTASLNNAISVSIGQGSACAVLSDSTVACWWENNNGQLGNGNYVNSAIPVLVRDATNTPITNVASVSVGAAGTVCAVLINGNMDCWWYGLYGLLWNGTNTKSNQAVTASLWGSIAKSVSVGMSHACVLLSDNTVKCWGSGANGTLWNWTYTESHVPVPVQGLSSANSISTVGDIGSCSVISDGTLSCWGDWYVYLTQGPTNSTTPVSLPWISSVLNIQGWLKHLCALLSDNTVKCWGYNYAGQIGTWIGTGRPDTTTWWIPTPLPVVGM
jgi:alpha-tubulin suppressor-like RCC1 family protein